MSYRHPHRYEFVSPLLRGAAPSREGWNEVSSEQVPGGIGREGWDD